MSHVGGAYCAMSCGSGPTLRSPTLTPVSSSGGYQQGHNTGGRWLPLGPHQRQHFPKGEQNPTGVLGPATPESRQSQTSAANFCSTGPKEEQGMHYRNNEVFTPETGATALLLDTPDNTAGTRAHKLAKTGCDSNFRCVKAIQRALFSFKNYL